MKSRRRVFFHAALANTPDNLPQQADEEDTGFVVLPRSPYPDLFDAPPREDLEPTELLIPVTGVVDSFM